MVDLGLVAGKRQRRAFKTKPEAETYADQARVARQNEGTAAFSLSGALRVDATKANQILSPHGSYHRSFHGDAMKTATLMGHKDPSLLHNHYQALVLKTEAEKYWNLRPEPVTAVNDAKETPSH